MSAPNLKISLFDLYIILYNIIYMSKTLIDLEYLKKYDAAKGTAVKEVEELPEVVENRIYNIDSSTVYSKGIQLVTKDYAKNTYIPLTQKGAANGVATLDEDGRIPTGQLPVAALVYKGKWDASTATYPEDGDTAGDFYVVSVAGTVDDLEFEVNDWIIWNGTSWDRNENANDVNSVNGQKGVVSLYADNLPTSSSDETTIASTISALKETIAAQATKIQELETTISSLNESYYGSIDMDNNGVTGTNPLGLYTTETNFSANYAYTNGILFLDFANDNTNIKYATIYSATKNMYIYGGEVEGDMCIYAHAYDVDTKEPIFANLHSSDGNLEFTFNAGSCFGGITIPVTLVDK